jgi:hypothetical protein
MITCEHGLNAADCGIRRPLLHATRGLPASATLRSRRPCGGFLLQAQEGPGVGLVRQGLAAVEEIYMARVRAGGDRQSTSAGRPQARWRGPQRGTRANDGAEEEAAEAGAPDRGERRRGGGLRSEASSGGRAPGSVAYTRRFAGGRVRRVARARAASVGTRALCASTLLAISRRRRPGRGWRKGVRRALCAGGGDCEVGCAGCGEDGRRAQVAPRSPQARASGLRITE